MKNITNLAKKIGFMPKEITPLGNQIAKVAPSCRDNHAKLILVTAQTSNKFGIGKTTVSIGLADALSKLKKNCMLALREPSMGPVFGVKGGAIGGGKTTIEPQNEINLHFTGDFHAIAQANNLLSSIIDNHIYFGNELSIDTNHILHKRCLDINDRSLREIEYEIRGKKIKAGFNITAASEVMAICCLARDLDDLKTRLGSILIAFSTSGKPIFAKDLHAEDAMTAILVDAMKPNLVATANGTPALVHLGPFANIAHGCNSIVATQTALSKADYVVTEAGFGSDLGAEKFLDIKCRELGRTPDAVVLVVVADTTKQHGNGDLAKGFENIKRHIHNIKDVFGLNLVIAVNKHKSDSADDIELLKKLCENENVKAIVSDGFLNGAKGCSDLASEVLSACKKTKKCHFAYELNDSIKDKIKKIAQKIYSAKDVQFSHAAETKIALAEKLNFSSHYVNIAKTQFSFTDDKNLLGAPTNHTLKITDIELRCGAKMIVAIAGNMLLMPGLARESAYLEIKVDKNGNITGIK